MAPELNSAARLYKDAVQEALRSERTTINISFFCYCKSGHHRSVAVATAMQHVLEVTKGRLRAEVINLNKSQWWQNCGDSCQEPCLAHLQAH